MYRLLKQEGAARRGEFTTVHGTVQTPAFMNVATAGAIKGAVSAYDLKDLPCQVQLCNTYHLHLRPGDETVKKLGGIRTFTGWDGPVLTDSGGFQVFSLAKLRNIKEEGVTFASHIDGRRIFMGPEESMRIQSNLGSTIAMAFDECVENPAAYEYAKASCARTARWLERCKQEMVRLNSQEDANLITSHINSFPKERLNGKTPFEMLKFLNPEMAERFIQFGIVEIEKDKVVLKPYLLKK